MRSASALSGLTIGVILLAIVALQPGETITLALAGDVMLGRGTAQSHAQGGWEYTLAALAPCAAVADIAFANLESPLTLAPLIKDTYDLRAPPEASLALLHAGFSVVSLANNHIQDAGFQGVQDTQRSLRAMGIHPIGPDEGPWMTKVNDQSLSWFAFDDTLRPLKIENLHLKLESQRPGTDLIIVSIHWGNELDTVPNARQRKLAMELATAGADIIIGHHSHVLQPIEWVWGSGRGRPTLVAYSLGNTLFDQAAPPGTRYGAVLLVNIGSAGVQSVCTLPTQIDPTSWRTIYASPTATEVITHSLKLSCILTPTCMMMEK
ncbi:MAG TPA: CapA family protein [Anaerolineae bacterium]|nr:CapA family protein [Anaerolineae bacterium]